MSRRSKRKKSADRFRVEPDADARKGCTAATVTAAAAIEAGEREPDGTVSFNGEAMPYWLPDGTGTEASA